MFTSTVVRILDWNHFVIDPGWEWKNYDKQGNDKKGSLVIIAGFDLKHLKGKDLFIYKAAERELSCMVRGSRVDLIGKEIDLFERLVADVSIPKNEGKVLLKDCLLEALA